MTAAALLLSMAGCSSGAPTEEHLDPPKPGSLHVEIGGLGSGGQAAVTVTGPNGFTQQLAEAQTLAALVPGSYAVQAAGVSMDGDSYDASPASQVVSVGPGRLSNASLSYAIATGRIALTVTGLPAGAQGTMTVTGPTPSAHPVAARDTIRGLAPGNYWVKAGAIVADSDRYAAAPDSILTLVTPGTAPSPVAFAYALASGRLAVTVSGAPAGTTPDITVTGPGSYSRYLSASETLAGLAPGAYSIVAVPVTLNGNSYAGSAAPGSVTVAASATPATMTVTYGISTGTLTVNVDGLPEGSAGSVTVTGPAAFQQAITATTTFVGVAPGVYTIAAVQVSPSGAVYTAQPASQTVTVAAGAVPVVRTVTYQQGVGTIHLTVSGLPTGVSGAVTVTGPGYSHTYASSATIGSLTPGSYTIAAASVTSGQTWSPSPLTQTVPVSVGGTVNATVTYVGSGGTLAVTVSGLPNGTNAAIVVSGPAGYAHNVTATATLTGLTAGTYMLAASPVTAASQTYNPTPTAPSVAVTAGAVTPVAISYAAAPATTFNLTIAAMYLTQAAAKLDGSTPLVAGRNAYLRVFAVANQANSATPPVRVRFYSGAVLVQTSTIPAPGSSVPTSVSEASLGSSWNLAVSGALMQSNLKIVADVDPAGAVLESSEADNQFPGAGMQAVDVRSLPTWNVRFVPILQQANGLQGNVTLGNGPQFLTNSLKLLPVAAYDADVRSVYTTTAPAVDAGDANGAWGTILSEMAALRGADASSRYYYGVLKTSYGSGVAGMGYVGGLYSAIGWDNLPSGSDVMAHEVGHNMGRSHSPSCGATGVDPGYPVSDGTIGAYGLDVTTLTVMPPGRFDFMGYCNPDWVSDYTWRGLITYRSSGPNNAPAAVAPAGTVSGLLIWGRVTSTGVVWEPAFRVPAPVEAATSQSGAYRITGRAADGSQLFSYGFDPVMTMVRQAGAPHEHHFSVVVPLDDRTDRALARLTLETDAGTFNRSAQNAVVIPGRPPVLLRDPGAILVRPNARQVRLQWDAATYPVAMVRDATGRVISFARGGSATLWSQSPRFEVVFSDGVAERRIRGVVPK
ncbi:MAG: hypothetical protein ABI647_04585 [Gemmatimonadota bacterium]